jgi:phosphoglycolate phosphatase-like HAD superfamily hydrolase
MGRYRVAVLDVDGTLIDSNDAHARAWEEVGREFGIDIPFNRVRPLVGMGGDRVLPMLTGLEEDDPRGERILERRGEIFRERHLPALRPFPRVRALLERMRGDGLALVVATSASEEDREALLKRAGVEDLVEDATGSGDVDRSKPSPDVVRAAVEKAGHPPHAVVMLGDTPYDVEACVSAGVDCIALRSGGWTDDDLRGAVAVYADAAELLDRYDGSPLGGA